MANALLFIGGLLFLGHLLVAVFQRTRIPDVLLLVLMGVLIGPSGLAWVHPGDFGKVGPIITTVALLVILFEGGVALHLPSLASALVPALLLTALTSAATVLLTVLIAGPFFETPFSAALLGVILCATSSAVVIPMLHALRLTPRARAILTLESIFADVICIALTFSLVMAHKNGRFDWVGLGGEIGWTLLMGMLLGLAGAAIWMVLLERVHRFPNTLFTEFAVVFILYGLAEHVGANGAIAALVFGITGANLSPRMLERFHLLRNVRLTQFNAFQKDLFGEAVFLVKLVFFVYLGLSLPFKEPAIVLLALVLTACLYAARVPTTLLTLPRSLTARDAALASAMVPKGLTAAVIASIPLQHGYAEGQRIQDITFSVVMVSITLTSVLVPVWEVFHKRLQGGILSRFTSSSTNANAAGAITGTPTPASATFPAAEG